MQPAFVHLRVHSEYSLSDGIVRVKPLVSATVKKAMPAVAITDINNLFALIKFYSAAQETGVKPLVAAEVRIAAQNENSDPTPLVLIARNNSGYRNLCTLISRSFTEGQNARHTLLQPQWIADSAGGLLAISGGKDGDVGQTLSNGRVEDALARTEMWMRIFPDAFYLELQRTGRAGEEDYNNQAVQIALTLGCPVVATNDVRFIEQNEFDAHEARVCIHQGRALDDPRREHVYSEQQYLKSPEEMIALFHDIPEAIENTVEIARRCNVDIKLGVNHLPEYQIPEGHTPESLLIETARNGLKERMVRQVQPAPDTRLQRIESTESDSTDLVVPEKYSHRLEYELEVINKMGFSGYFLIVMEFVQWARDQGIPVGPGRGSGVGSLVAYALLITDIDPLEFDLIFERFLNLERISLPDIDIDFCIDGRDKVIHHVMERYGKEVVSQIITFGTMAAKAVVRDVARVQGKPYGLADKLSKMIPFEPGMTLSRAMEEERSLQEFLASNDEAEEIMEMAFKLEGLARNVGKHAGGVVIAPTRLTDFCPIYCDVGGDGMMTQFDMIGVEQVGLVKFDFLGLRTLTIIDNTVKSINRVLSARGERCIGIDSIPLDDPGVYADLQKAKTTAIFQLESRGMKDLIKKVKPNRFTDIVALVALYRPGPMQLADDFVKRKHGSVEVDYLHPKLEGVLEGTYGVMLYQEQVMQIAQVLAGYTLADADILRQAMGKKKQEEMANQRQVFIAGAAERGVDEKQADHIFSLMEKFAGYGFNKTHSVAYALIAYQTAWLKHHYPADFMAAVLSADMQNTDKVVIGVDECSALGLKLTPPDVNRGEFKFKAESENNIIYGLGAIKGLGEGPVSAIVDARQKGEKFKDLYDFCERVETRWLNKRTMEALIGSGALDSLVSSDLVSPDMAPAGDLDITFDFKRSLLYANQGDALKLAEQKALNIDRGMQDLFGDDMMLPTSEQDRYNYYEILQCQTLKDRLGKEKETLGLFLTAHPVDIYHQEMKYLAKSIIADLRTGKKGQIIAGSIIEMRTMRNRKGESIAFVTLDDRTGRIDVSVSANLYDQHRDHLRQDDVIVVQGDVSADDFTNGIRFRASAISSIVQARARSAKTLVLHVYHETTLDFAVTLADKLAETLVSYKGGNGHGCPVTIEYHGRDVQGDVILGDEWRVMPEDELLQNLRDHYGAERVNLQY